MIVVALGKLRRRVVVDDESHLGMQLKGGSGDRGGDWVFDGLRDRSGLRCAGGEQDNFTRLQDVANADGDGATRTLLTGRKEVCVVVQPFLVQKCQARR